MHLLLPLRVKFSWLSWRIFCDMFAKLNQSNNSLQGKDTHLLQLHDKITAFKRKLQL